LHGAFVVVGGVFMAAAAIHLLLHRLTPASA
jgi:hypothetical protein